MRYPINKENLKGLIQKYPFLSSIDVECVEKNKSHVYMDTTLVFETTPLPEKYYELKYDVYTMVKENTQKTPIARSGWRILNFSENFS
jgi:hypothetical protein